MCPSMSEKDDRHVTVPLMVRVPEELQFVEDDNDTVSENEPSSTGNSRNPSNSGQGNIYTEIPERRRKIGYLEIPRIALSRSNSSVSSSRTSPTLERKSSRKKSNPEYEKVSVTSNASSKKSTVERIAESAFFRRRTDTAYARGDEDEHILESLRLVNQQSKRSNRNKFLISNEIVLQVYGSYKRFPKCSNSWPSESYKKMPVQYISGMQAAQKLMMLVCGIIN
ncbi:hypothetical protein JTE90_024847 [Oedothorax gibbosus]|uniref:Uncharacterized protein n=1 Tax=Oedothorax gibbosus TaxID=931172 RepID=A0AAV6U9E1_9ARAC|nr:hypothetical protein JTE90_024847 [Oedothorax gibbosus]